MSKSVELSTRKLDEGEKLLLVVDIEGVGDELELQPVLSIGWVVCRRINFDSSVEPEEEIYEKGRVTFKPDISSDSSELRKEYKDFLEREESHSRRIDIPDPKRYISHYCWFFSTRCYNEFWKQQPAQLLETLYEESLCPERAISYFLSVEDRFPIGEVMSDNPSYDLTRIDFAIKRYTYRSRRYGMHYTKEGKYRTVSDPSEIYHYLPPKIKSIIKQDKATHFPDDDALDIYRFALKIKRAVNDWEKIH